MKKNATVLLIWLLISFLLTGCAGDTAARKKRAEAKERLGGSLIQKGDLLGGLKELLEAAELDPENADIQYALGLAYKNLREYDKSIFHFRKALKLKPDFPEAQNNLGTVYVILKDWDTALGMFKKAAENNMYRTRHIAYENLGSVFYNKREYKKAIQNYKKAVELYPRYSPAYDKMGLTYEKLTEWDLAVESYKRSIEYAPNRAISHLRLGRLYLRLDRHEEAAEELNKTIETDTTGFLAKEAKNLLRKVRISP